MLLAFFNIFATANVIDLVCQLLILTEDDQLKKTDNIWFSLSIYLYDCTLWNKKHNYFISCIIIIFIIIIDFT